MTIPTTTFVLATALCTAVVLAPALEAARKPPTLLVVTVTKGFRHDAIPVAERVLQELADKSGAFTLDFARTDEDLAAKTTAASLNTYAGAVFADTTGDLPLADPQGFLDWIARGHAFVGIHAATDTFPNFPPYLDMLGAQFKHHGPQTTVDVIIADPKHASTRAVPQPLAVFDEIYQFQRYDPARVHLLLTIHKHPESGEPGEFPLAWTRMHGKGRVFYTALGHRPDVLESEWYKAHLRAGLLWALGK